MKHIALLALAAALTLAQAADHLIYTQPFTGSAATPADGVRTVFAGQQPGPG